MANYIFTCQRCGRCWIADHISAGSLVLLVHPTYSLSGTFTWLVWPLKIDIITITTIVTIITAIIVIATIVILISSSSAAKFANVISTLIPPPNTHTQWASRTDLGSSEEEEEEDPGSPTYT